jgi:putative phosphoesterase
MMRIGLLSDTHDHLPAIAALVRRMAEVGCSLVMHAGDYCAPFSFAPIHDVHLPVLGVFGRNDGDHAGLVAAASSGGVSSELYASPHSFQVGGHSVLLVHDLAEVQQRSIDAHEIVVHGFTHLPEMKTRGNTLLVAPGEGCGWLHGAPTAAILDLESRAVEFLKLGPHDVTPYLPGTP